MTELGSRGDTEEHILTILQCADIGLLPRYERPGRILEMSRVVLELPPGVCISEVDQGTREEILAITAGVRDGLLAEDAHREAAARVISPVDNVYLAS